jgi:hypothetical protein
LIAAADAVGITIQAFDPVNAERTDDSSSGKR